MPPLAKLARKLHLKRIDEIKEEMRRDEEEFRFASNAKKRLG